MSEPFVGEIRMFAGNFAPRAWAFCDGQLLAISQNDVLFSLLGTIYGGDGRTTFGLPDMRGRIPVHAGTGPGLNQIRLGAKAGAENVSLTSNQMPSHDHNVSASSASATSNNPTGNVSANTTPTNIYSTSLATPQTMSPAAISTTGGSQSHSNLMPSLCVNFIIALFGIFPSRN